MYEINKLLHGQGACTGFSHSLFAVCIKKSHSLAVLARSISATSPTRAKIPYARPAHEVISTFHIFCYVKKVTIVTLILIATFRLHTVGLHEAIVSIY